MRRFMLGLAAILGFAVFATPAPAQFFGNGNADPFFLYYGFYLPRQAAMAVQPRPQDTINALSAARQYSALTERASLYDPVQPFGTYNPNQLFGEQAAGRRGGMATHGANINGSGPRGYYNRTHTYFPGLRSGQGASTGAGYTLAPRRQSFGGGWGGLPHPASGLAPGF